MKAVAWALALAGLLAAPAGAVVVRGTITDASGTPVRRARVVAFDASAFLETRSSWRGAWFLDVPAGSWRLGVAAPGFEYVEVGVTVAAAEVVQDLVLGPEVHPGSWEMIGDTLPESPGASNSGSLLADGSYLVCHDTRDAVRFDPVTRVKTFPPDSNDEQGCSAVTLLSTGELLFVGGQDTGTFTDATERVKTFDGGTGQWAILPSMNEQRWYPSLARLADETLLVCGGGQRPDATRTPTCETWDPGTRLWTRTTDMAQPSEYSPMALLHEGEVLKTWFPPERWDPVLGTWRPASPTVQDRSNVFPDHCDHSLTVLRNGEVVITGRIPAPADPITSMAEHYDPCADGWRVSRSDGVVLRSRVEQVPLPDGRILVAAGRLEENDPTVQVTSQGYTRLVDLYDPLAEAWRPVETMRIEREYHATEVLVPDGRVVMSQGTGLAGQSTAPDAGVDAYSPPYLFRGPRPLLNAISSTTLRNGDVVELGVARAREVTSVVMLGTRATTHYVDGAVPRRLGLSFTQEGDRLSARIPASPLAAPAGWYILFVMIDDVPSDGRILLVQAPPTAPAPDLVGDVLRVAKEGADVVLEWRHGALNPSRYNVYRSGSAASLALSAAAIGTASALAARDDEELRDAGAADLAAPDLYFYRVLGRACDGSGLLP